MKKINLSILKVLFLLTTLIISSCSNNDDNEIKYDLSGKYIHLIVDCDNSNNSEINCTEFVEFNNSGIVNVLIGGDDIAYQTEYEIKNSNVEFEKAPGLNYNISFEIVNNSTLKRIEDGEIWTKNN